MLVPSSLFLAFLLAAAIICVTPGPDMVYVATFGLSKGWRGGISAAAGIALGMMFHTVLASVGISLILRAAQWPLVALRFAGAAYLVYMGVQMIRDRSHLTVGAHSPDVPYPRIVASSALVNITNPKILVFYLTFLPQFTSRSSGNIGIQMAFMGAIFVLMGFLTDASIGIISGKLLHGLTEKQNVVRYVNVLGGCVLCVLAATILFLAI